MPIQPNGAAIAVNVKLLFCALDVTTFGVLIAEWAIIDCRDLGNGMSTFDRRISRILALQEIAAKSEAHWWKDLLRLWRPSGIAAGELGLRLAIRNGYFNFYRRGQSVARVSFDRAGNPVASVHVKYVSDSSAREGKSYARLVGDQIIFARNDQIPYVGPETLLEWIGVIDGAVGQAYAGAEKTFVDRLVDNNSGIIDLEMGLPAWEGHPTPPRMDIVALERAVDGIKIVFWEAKLDSDGRVRCRPGRAPEVWAQLDAYRDFLRDEGRRGRVEAAYSKAAALLMNMREMAALCENHVKLGKLIDDAAVSQLTVDPVPRLVIFNQTTNQAGWGVHRDRLEAKGKLCEIGPLGPFDLHVAHPVTPPLSPSARHRPGA